MIAAPIILYPKTNWTASGDDSYYSSDLVQKISGSIPIVASEIEANTILTVRYRFRISNADGVTAWSSFLKTGITVGATDTNMTEIPWFFNTEGVIDYSIGDTVELEFKTVKISSNLNDAGPVLDESAVSPLNVIIVAENVIEASVEPVTGVYLEQSRDEIKLFIPASGIVINDNSEFAGTNFYVSIEEGGGEDGYQVMNNVLVTDPDSTETQRVPLIESSAEDTAGEIEITTTRTRVIDSEFYTYTFNKDVITRLILAGKIPNIFLSDGITLREDITYYFVMTTTVFDESLNQAVESAFSLELSGVFITYTTDFQSLPERSRSDIVFTMSEDMMSNNAQIAAVGGSVLRDIVDPIALEFEKFYTIQDFVFATLSIDTLLAFDDSDGDGISDPIELNVAKRRLADALGVSDNVNLQILIDEQFDKQAANYNLTRAGASTATGTVLFYITTTPTEDVLIPDGTIVTALSNPEENRTAQNFIVQGTKLIDSNNLDFYYNPVAKRYEIESDIIAESAGAAGNVPAGAITVAGGLRPFIQVTNNVPTLYGSDRETNQKLSDRVKLARISYDSGTEGGYSDTVLKVPGVSQVRVEKEGDPLMVRDYDSTDSKHIGGKVDIYVKGRKAVQLTDQVAFKYEYPTDTFGNKVGEVFSVIDAQEYRIKTNNAKVTNESPIVIVNTVRNVTRGADYDLTDMQIIGDGDTIVLSPTLVNTQIGMATFDVVEVDYRYRSTNLLVLSNQPVDSIVQVADSGGALVDQSKYQLVKLEDPLTTGESSISKDAVQFLFNEGDNINEFIAVDDEQHDMLLNIPARLDLLGVDIGSIVVTSVEDSSLVFKRDVDYTITPGSETTYTYLNLVSTGMIRHGDRVSVSYNASENFDVTYITNGLISEVQTKVNAMKHACADAIIKQAIGNPVDISFRVVRKTGTDKSLLKARIQTAIANYVSRLTMGETFSQGVMLNVVQNVNGVKEVKMPLTRMMKRNDSFIPLDNLGALTFEVYQKTSGSGVTSYRSLNSVLRYLTSDNGGPSNLFRAVYENNIALTLASNPADVASGAGRAYIQPDGKIIVSTIDGRPPQTKLYKAAYYTFYPADVNVIEDIETSEIEYIVVDNLSLKDIEIIDELIVKRGL